MTYYFSTHLAAYQAACQRVESLESSLRIYRNGHSSCSLAAARVAQQLDDAYLEQEWLKCVLKQIGAPGFTE